MFGSDGFAAPKQIEKFLLQFFWSARCSSPQRDGGGDV